MLQKQALENEMLAVNDTPDQYSSLISLDDEAAFRNNINMKGNCVGQSQTFQYVLCSGKPDSYWLL